MKILVWTGKYGDEHIDATDEREALKFLFTIIDKECGYYDPEFMDKYAAGLYEKAKAGDMTSITRFMFSRQDHEYEGWEFEDVQTVADADFKKRFGKDRP